MANRCLVPFTNICTPNGAPLTGYTDVDTGERTFYSATGLYVGPIETCFSGDSTGGGTTGTDMNSVSSVQPEFTSEGESGFIHDPGNGDPSTFIPIISTVNGPCSSVRLFEDGLDGHDTETIKWTYIADGDVCPTVDETDVECVDRWTAPADGCIIAASVTLPVPNSASGVAVDAGHDIVQWRWHSDLQGALNLVSLPAGDDKATVDYVAGSFTFSEGECLWPLINTNGTGPLSPVVQLSVRYAF